MKIKIDSTPEREFIEKVKKAKVYYELSLVQIGSTVGLCEAQTSKLLSGKRRLLFNEAVLLSQAYEIPLV